MPKHTTTLPPRRLWLLLALFLTIVGADPAVSKWPWPHRGDVRAVVVVPPLLVGKEVSVAIEWRRHDVDPEHKQVLVTDHADRVIGSNAPVVTQHRGVVTFNSSLHSANQTYFVYWLPYTQSGIGAGMKFAWDYSSNASSFKTIGSFTPKMDTRASQTFILSSPYKGSQFRWQCSKTGLGFQPFLNEVRLVCSDANYSTCYPNATKAKHLPVVTSSGYQPGGSGEPHDPWMAMDGNLSTYWDATIRDAWFNIELPHDRTVAAVEVHNYGDKDHDCGAFDLKVPIIAPHPSHHDWRKLPAVPQSAILIEARNDFESFKPMELAANTSEVAVLLAARGGAPPYLLFTEPRELPVRMQDRIPVHWTTDAPADPSMTANVTRGEYFTWQVAVFVPPGAARITNVSLDFGNFGAIKPTCFNFGGVDAQGKTLRTAVNIEADRIRSFWIGAQIPESLAVGGVVKGEVVFSAGGVKSTTVPVTLTVSSTPVQTVEPEPAKMSRLRWLNSDLYTNDYGLVPPYTAIVRNGNALDILNRRILVGTSPGTAGLPVQINVTRQASKHGTLPAKTISLFSSPMEIELIDDTGSKLTLAESAACGPGLPQYTEHGDGLVSWVSYTSSRGICIALNLSLAMEGMISASVSLHASENSSTIELQNIHIKISFAKQHGLSWAGLAKRGQSGSEAGGLSISKGNFSWAWRTGKKSEQLFVGSANAGMKLHLQGNTSEWLSPIERFYDGSMTLPDEWGANNGKGGINASVTAEGGVDVVLFTGPQRIGMASSSSSKGVFTLNFDITATPFKTPNETQHWSLRHFQVGYPGSQFTSAADVKKTGANVINIHQGVSTMINPYINYPFVPESVDLLAKYTKEANDLGMRVKFYYTVRELTNHAAEIFALRMLEDEIYATEPACGYGNTPCTHATAWQHLHLGGNFSSAWTCPLSNGEYDAAIRQNKLAGRWLNYYIEGLRESVAAPPYIQGVYYDGILFGRDTMLRARKVLERDTPAGNLRPLMDFHAGNDDPGNGQVDAVGYANIWAFVDSLWMGEGYSYNSNPVFWLFEISGLAFGLFSDMLGTPNNYRGMLFGSTGRPGTAFPKHMWDFWDEFGIQQTDMVGFWQEDTPVRVADQKDIFTNDSGVVLATCYVNKQQRKTLIALASWASKVQSVTIDVDWEVLGMNSSWQKTVNAPAILGFQTAKHFGRITTDMPSVTVQPGKGWLIVVMQEPQGHSALEEPLMAPVLRNVPAAGASTSRPQINSPPPRSEINI